MAAEPAQGQPASPAPERKPGWFLRLPLWARIVIPTVVLAGAGAIVIAVSSPREPADPVEAAEAACRSAVLAELESHDMAAREVSFVEVTPSGGDGYLVRGDAAFRDDADDGAPERRVQLRCTVRVENGEMRAPSIRYSEPISAD